MFKEIDLCGIFVAPIFGCVVTTAIAFIPLSWYFDRCEIQHWVANRPVFDASVFVLLLGFFFLTFQMI
jgi:hypothetical protein